MYFRVTSGRFETVHHGQSTLSRMSEQRYQEATEKWSARSMDLLPSNELDQLKGGNFFWSQIKAMVLKKTLYTWRNWILIVVQILIPVILTIITVLIARTFSVGDELRALPITLDLYTNNPVVLLSNEVNSPTSAGNDFLEAYRTTFIDPPTQRTLQELPMGTTIPSYINGLSNQELITHNARTLAGVTIRNDEAVAWFNNQPYHTIPLSVNLAYNALLSVICPTCSISVTNHPLPFTLQSRLDMLQAGNNMGFQLASNIGFSMSFVAAFYIIFYIRERVSRSKLLQFVSGINIWTFWLTAYIWDIITFIVTTCFMVATLVAFQEDGWSSGSELGRVIVLSVCFIWAVLPFIYLFSMIFDVPSSGFIKTVMVGIFLGVAVFYTVFSLSIPALDLVHVADALTWTFLIVPHFAMIHGLSNLNEMNTLVSVS